MEREDEQTGLSEQAHADDALDFELPNVGVGPDPLSLSDVIGKRHDLLGRLPQSLVLDTRGEDADVIFTHRGDGVDDRPAVEDLIGTVEDVQESFVFDCSLVEC